MALYNNLGAWIVAPSMATLTFNSHPPADECIARKAFVLLKMSSLAALEAQSGRKLVYEMAIPWLIVGA